jgi:ubiquinone/menaquinone biosynthesis C-methylase UbiE
MPDIWSTTAELDPATQERLADLLELRGADVQQQEMRRRFLDTIDFAVGAPVLEVGCGTGVLTRQLAQVPAVGSVVGTDIAPGLLKRARALAADLDNVTFQTADARELPFASDSFSTVVFDSTLSHVPTQEQALAEAFRVLLPSGLLAIFDGDYATATVAVGHDDPLQTCVDAMIGNSVSNKWLVRRLPMLARTRGFVIASLSSYGFVDFAGGSYMLQHHRPRANRRRNDKIIRRRVRPRGRRQ